MMYKFVMLEQEKTLSCFKPKLNILSPCTFTSQSGARFSGRDKVHYYIEVSCFPHINEIMYKQHSLTDWYQIYFVKPHTDIWYVQIPTGEKSQSLRTSLCLLAGELSHLLWRVGMSNGGEHCSQYFCYLSFSLFYLQQNNCYCSIN